MLTEAVFNFKIASSGQEIFCASVCKICVIARFGNHIKAIRQQFSLRGKQNFQFGRNAVTAIGVQIDADTVLQNVDISRADYGNSVCGVNWEAYNLTSERDHLIQILIHNPHNYGNENAIDEMLSKVTLWTPIEFEKGVLDSGATQRSIGLAIIIASVMFLGTALFSSLIHVKNSKFIWLLGLVILFAGIYFTYSSFGISFWSESIVFNTSILGISMMLYTLFLSMLITMSLKKTKKVGVVTCLILGIVNTIFFILPMKTKVFFYDTWRYWSIIQSVANVALIVCTINELIHVKGKN